MTRIRVVGFASARPQNTTYTSRLLDSPTTAMDSDLIKLVNRLQDTFNDLGMCMVALGNGQLTNSSQAGSWICPSWSWSVMGIYPRLKIDIGSLVGWQPIFRQI